MRPRFRSANADLTAHATADLSRWTHRVGVTGRSRDKTPPPGNAIGLSSPVGGLVGRINWRAKPVAFRPPPSYVPKASLRHRRRDEYGRRQVSAPRETCGANAMP